MNGPPKDIEGWCNAWLLLGDDYGDNVATIRCQRPPNHASAHQSIFQRGEDSGLPKADDQRVCITWTVDESIVCETHGRVQAPSCCRCDAAKDEEVGS